MCQQLCAYNCADTHRSRAPRSWLVSCCLRQHNPNSTHRLRMMRRWPSCAKSNASQKLYSVRGWRNAVTLDCLLRASSSLLSDNQTFLPSSGDGTTPFWPRLTTLLALATCYTHAGGVRVPPKHVEARLTCFAACRTTTDLMHELGAVRVELCSMTELVRSTVPTAVELRTLLSSQTSYA